MSIGGVLYDSEPHEDDIKIQLDYLRMEGSALAWWETRTQEEIKNYGKIYMCS